MSAVLALFGRGAPLPSEEGVTRAMDAMAGRGTEVRDVYRDERAVLAVGRFAWETDPAIGGPARVARDGALVAVTDAAIYHRAALEAELARAGVLPVGPDPGHLVLAAYRAWGADLARHLDGDFAFVVWDGETGTAVAARDFVGLRPLFHASAGGLVVVASTLRGARAVPGVGAELDPVGIAAHAAEFFGEGERTCFRGVDTLLPGRSLLLGPGSGPTLRRHWHPPAFLSEDEPEIGFDEAAAHLRALLERAVAERTPPTGPYVVTLSGGYDSPAVYAAAHQLHRASGDDRDRLRPLSISFPEGDSGREDEMILSIAGHHGQEPHWLRIGDMPFFGTFRSGLDTREDPFLHSFEGFNRALARGTRECGARVALNGGGGDHLFHAEAAFLRDLLRRGRLAEFARELRIEQIRSRGDLVNWVLRPLLTPSLRGVIGRVAPGRAPDLYLERRLPPWMAPDFAAEHRLQERESAALHRRSGEGAEAWERRWMLEYPLFGRVLAEASTIALREGVEIRSPLFDRGVLAFAASRPRRERRSGRETKRLLRAAVADILPQSATAARRSRTGTTLDYFQHAMVREFPRIAAPVFRNPVLAELGIVDRDQLYRIAGDVERGRISVPLSALLATLHAEVWVRHHLGQPIPEPLADPNLHQ